MKRFIIRLYAAHDADLIYASCNPCITFSNFVCTALTCFVNQEPLDTSLWEKKYEVNSIRSKQITLYLNETKDAPIIALLNSSSCINALVKGILRLYLTQVCGPKTISDIYLSDKVTIPVAITNKVESKPKKNPNAAPTKEEIILPPVEPAVLPDSTETTPTESSPDKAKESAVSKPTDSAPAADDPDDITHTASGELDKLDPSSRNALKSFFN